jgi:hypothetical protein
MIQMEWRFVTAKSQNKPQGARVGVEVSTFSEILVGAESGLNEALADSSR